jgi:hypothetical protein
MDTVWTTVKVRRSVLSDACELMPGLSNAAVVQRALEQASGSVGQKPSGSPVPARASNTSASSGGGPSSGVIPGESGRGAGVGRGETDTGDARTREPADPARTLDHQTDIYEMLGACPECAGKMVQIAGVESCEDCGFTREP